MGKKRYAHYFDGVITVGAEVLPDPVSFSVKLSPRLITHNQGDGKGEVSWPIGRKVGGSVNFTAMTAEVLAVLTGGAAAVGTFKRIRQGEENHTITTNTITLTEAGDVIAASVRLFGSGGTVFKKVASAPDVGEFSYASATGVCTFNAAETDTSIYPDYLYADSAAGLTVTVGPVDIPSEIALYGSLRAKDMNASTLGDTVIYLRHVNLIGDFEFGGDSGGNTKEMTLEFSAEVAAEGDFTISFPG